MIGGVSAKLAHPFRTLGPKEIWPRTSTASANLPFEVSPSCFRIFILYIISYVGPVSNLGSNEWSSKFIAIKICGELVSMYRIATFPNSLSMRGGFSGERLLEEPSISK